MGNNNKKKQKEQLVGKALTRFIKRNLEDILVLDNKGATALIKDSQNNYKVDINNATSEVRKLVVDKIGKKLFADKIQLSEKNYVKLINEIEENTGLLCYNRSGKQLYKVWISDNITKLNKISIVKGSEDSNISVEHVEHILTKVKTERIEENFKIKDQQLQEKLEEHQTEIENIINTHLNELEDEDEDDEALISNKITQQWWEQIGLTQNPFNENGLKNINKEDYDNILIDNSAILRAKEFRKGNKNSFTLGSNYMITGKLGTGKTAAIEYIKEFSSNQKIESFIARMPQSYNLDDMRQNFYTGMLLYIKRWYSQNNINYPHEGNVAELEFIIILDDMLKHSKGSLDGFFIFIEDLHKQKNQEVTFEFISTLQTLTESLAEYDIKASIIISGIPEWEKKIINDPTLTSVIPTNNIIKIIDVTPKIATRAIDKRFEVFKVEKNDYNKFKLAINTVQNLTTIIDNTKTHTGFRLYFQEIKKELEKGNFGIFDINPIAIDKELSKDYQRKLKEHPDAQKILNNIYKTKIYNYSQSMDNQRQIVLSLLSKLFTWKIINKNDDLVSSRKVVNIFTHLFRLNAVTMDTNHNWQPVQSLQKFHNSLIRDFGFGLNYFLTSYYLNKQSDPKTINEDLSDKEWNLRLKELQIILVEEGSLPEIDVINIIDELENLLFKPHYEIHKGYDTIDIEQIKNVVSKLSSINLKSLSTNFAAINKITDAIYFKHNIKDEELRYFEQFHNKATVDNQRFMISAIDCAEKTIEEYSNRYKLLKKVNRPSLGDSYNINSDYLNRDIQNIIFKETDTIENKQIDQLQEKFQDILRKYLFISSSLTFGDARKRKSILKKCIPSLETTISKRRKNSMVTDQIDPNEFEQLQRSEFNDILDDGKFGIFGLVVRKPLIDKIKKESFISIINKFAQINLASSHDKESELKEFISSNNDLVYDMLSIIKDIHKIIIEKIINQRITIRTDQGDYVCFVDLKRNQNFKSFASKQITGKGKKGEIGLDESKAFMKICDNLDIHCWKVYNINNSLFDKEGSLRLIDLTNINSISKTFGNLVYGAGIANLMYSISEDDIPTTKIYGTEYLFSAEL